jgi:hypothetical protein
MQHPIQSLHLHVFIIIVRRFTHLSFLHLLGTLPVLNISEPRHSQTKIRLGERISMPSIR